MSESVLFWTVYERMVDAGIESDVAAVVEAAFYGASELTAVLEGGPPPSRGGRPAERAKPKPSSLTRLEVTGFRGIGPKATLELPPGPGLTLVTGRNGSGKSSFAEALEVLLTGAVRRLDSRPKDWKEGWRNLHGSGAADVRATFAVEGQRPTVIARQWPVGAVELSASTTQGLEDLGWTTALQTHRPFLAHTELGALLESGPSRAYDSLKAILGLDELTIALQLLADARLSRERVLKEAKTALTPLVERLKASVDPRAARARDALGKTWDIEALEPLLTGDGADPLPTVLRRLAELRAPVLDTGPLRMALDAQAENAGEDSARQLRMAELLTHALEWHGKEGDAACPVCGAGALDAAWEKTAAAEVAALRKGARAASEAVQAVRAAVASVRPPPPPSDLRADPSLAPGLIDAALAAWNRLANLPVGPADTLAHVEAHLPAVQDAVEKLVAHARERVATLEDAWRPIRLALGGWLPGARAARAGERTLPRLKAAEAWLKGAEAALQTDRFAPIGGRAQATWVALRQESSVDLTAITLAGAGNRRHLELALTVDGTEASLGVMSQGEINALALSLFIPRLVHEDSPFHFLIIDDPVQSMDPFKVDGLAQVLQEAARTRQVIVFTHDTRLSEAVHRMQIPATILSVGRRARSAVDVRKELAPAEQALSDARAVARSEVEVGRTVLLRVVPGLCREAVERTLQASVRRQLLMKGEALDVVEGRIRAAGKMQALAALAIYLDDTRGGDVYGWLNQKGAGLADTFRELKEAVHTGVADESLVRRTEGLVRRLEASLS